MAAHSEFPWARMLGICALTLLASTSFYTVVTKNAEAMVVPGGQRPGDHRQVHHAGKHRRAPGYVHLLGAVAAADPLAAADRFRLARRGFHFDGSGDGSDRLRLGFVHQSSRLRPRLADHAGVGYPRLVVFDSRPRHRHVAGGVCHRTILERHGRDAPQQAARRTAARAAGDGRSRVRICRRCMGGRLCVAPIEAGQASRAPYEQHLRHRGDGCRAQRPGRGRLPREGRQESSGSRTQALARGRRRDA